MPFIERNAKGLTCCLADASLAACRRAFVSGPGLW